jgi:kumamolisin
MVRKAKSVPLEGSKRRPAPATRAAGDLDPKEEIAVTVRVRARKKPRRFGARMMKMGALQPRVRRYLTRDELAREYGAAAADFKKVEDFAKRHDLDAERHVEHRTVTLKGTIAAFSAAFEVTLQKVRIRKHRYRGRTGPVHIPKELAGIIVGVHGLDNRPAARQRRPSRPRVAGGRKAAKTDRTLAVPDVAALYNFPAKLTGKGQCIALIELNMPDDEGNAAGGYDPDDIARFFKRLGIRGPRPVTVSVDGGVNRPGHSVADREVVTDIEVAGAAAPGARLVVYFAPNTTSGFLNAVKAAVHDTKHRPTIISISWGAPEGAAGPASGRYSPQFMYGMHEMFEDAAALGITVCCSSGDDGSADMREHWDGRAHADFPAASPFALGCGGTRLAVKDGRIAGETVWNARQRGTGGGVSRFFGPPPYQAKVKLPRRPTKQGGRGVPDVAGNADPVTGYKIFINGKPDSAGGTSAVAPLMAGLVARINEHLVKTTGRTAGFINPLLYSADFEAAFRDITAGNNDVGGRLAGKYPARKGWDACTGLGVPDGETLLQLLSR